MKTFRDYLSEEVMPSALVADGSIDIEKDAVRDNINGLLAGSMACSSVTPYNALMKVRKVLAYFGIQLPKRAYMEGKHGIEVWEVHQFGDRMGMNDQGEFIKSVPAKYYLFFHYHMFGSMFSVRAKIVDREELDKEIDMAEMMIKEDAAMCQNRSKVVASHEEMHDLEDESTESTKNAVEVSMRRKDKKLSADSLDEEQVDEAKKEPVYTHEKGPLYGTVTDHGDGKFSTRRKVGMFWRTKSHKSKESAIAHLQNKKLKEETLDEKAPPGAKFERMVKHIKKGYSKDGLTAKEKSIAYATAWKAKNKEQMDESMGSVKKDTGYRKFKTKVNTVVRRGLGKKRDTNTILVTMKGDPRARTGGGVRRIPKDKYDPSKHNMATE